MSEKKGDRRIAADSASTLNLRRAFEQRSASTANFQTVAASKPTSTPATSPAAATATAQPAATGAARPSTGGSKT